MTITITTSGIIPKHSRLRINGIESPILNATPVFATCTIRKKSPKNEYPIVKTGIFLTINAFVIWSRIITAAVRIKGSIFFLSIVIKPLIK